MSGPARLIRSALASVAFAVAPVGLAPAVLASVASIALASIALAPAGCDAPRSPGPVPSALDAPASGADGLRAYLTALVAVDAPRRRAAIAAWPVPAARWPAVVASIYRAHYPAYASRATAAMDALAARLDAGGAVATRLHYADDLTLASSLRRERLALPVGRPAVIATVGGRDLPAVFVFDRDAWHALVGLDDLTRDAIAGFDPACAATYAAVGAPGHCMDASAPVASLALGAAAARPPGARPPGASPPGAPPSAVPDDLATACRRLAALAAIGCDGDRGSVAAPTP